MRVLTIKRTCRAWSPRPYDTLKNDKKEQPKLPFLFSRETLKLWKEQSQLSSGALRAVAAV
jgi:hypothetical protein